ncbi:MAG: hypothetical protein JXN59_18525, partial [Anaerolineae bacterium]|nr:hypothetical protein [Anaerolineae bacterium]
QSAPLYQQTGRDAVWLAVGQAALAVFRDDPAATVLYDAAQKHFAPDERGFGFAYGENLAWFNFYRGTFSQQFVPQLAPLSEAWDAQFVLEALVQ